MLKALEMRCLQHKRYKGILRPRTDCVECWQIFLSKSADYNVVCKEIESRKPVGETFIAEFDPGPNEARLIRHMLYNKKKEMEERYYGKESK